MRITDAAAPADLDGTDLSDPTFYATGDPHPVWAAMRAHAPLHRQVLPDGRAFWSVTRHHDVCRVLGDQREFTSERGSLLLQLGKREAAAGKMLVATDPPRHALFRRPLNALFTERLTAIREPLHRAVRRCLEPAGEPGVWDLAPLAAEIPTAVAGALLDLPEPDRSDLGRWAAMAAAPHEPAYTVHSPAATLAVAHHELFDYFARLAAARAGTDGHDVIRFLNHLRVDDRPLATDEVVFNCYSILLGATATTPHTITGTVLALAEHPDQYQALRADPTLIPRLVEEGLRWTSPANSFLRHTTAPTHLAGGPIPGGDAVVAWIGSANRDHTVFDHPYRFDLTRPTNRHVAFGHGPHYCLGAGIARLTLHLFFTELTRIVTHLELAAPPTHLASNFVAGITHLPIRTTPHR